MRLTEHQLASTALRIVAERLNDLLGPHCGLEDWVIDQALCADHCPAGGCVRDRPFPADEVDQVRAKVRRAVEYLRQELDVYAMKQGVDWKALPKTKGLTA